MNFHVKQTDVTLAFETILNFQGSCHLAREIVRFLLISLHRNTFTFYSVSLKKLVASVEADSTEQMLVAGWTMALRNLQNGKTEASLCKWGVFEINY